MQIVGVSGSLRGNSSNTKLLDAASRIVGAETRFEVSKHIGQLPLFTPDLAPDSSEMTSAWITQIRNCDGLVISTPEYAGGYPGALKNALDWLVQSDAFVSKPFMFLRASPRAVASHRSLKAVLATMSGIHIERADALVPLLGKELSTDQIVADREYRATISDSLGLFADRIRNLSNPL